MIYHLDEHISERFTETVEGRGLDVVSIDRLRRKGLDEASNRLLAARLSRVLVSYDVRDYSLLHHAWQVWSTAWVSDNPPRHAGIALLHSHNHADFDDIVDALLELAEAVDDATNRLFVWNYGRGWAELV